MGLTFSAFLERLSDLPNLTGRDLYSLYGVRKNALFNRTMKSSYENVILDIK
jgi:hypothetical protein